ncbi:MAG: GNAT family N-acetyltransferase [Deltaproteobacteria bacterium]|nr:GNAT family N-acetyltransferase [Deltaproteobacteria bacterium]
MSEAPAGDVHPTPSEHTVTCPQGALRIVRACSPDELRALTFDTGIGRFARYRSIVSSIDTLEKVAGLPDANVTVAISPAQQIVGYIECSYPDAIEGWHDNADGLCYELGAIEVSRNWRRQGVARAMVATLLTDTFIESKIFFLTGYSWHWDTDQTGLSVYAYRNLLVRLFRPFGFQVYITNNPEIRISSANVLMARIGRYITTAQRERFHKMLFTFEP